METLTGLLMIKITPAAGAARLRGKAPAGASQKAQAGAFKVAAPAAAGAAQGVHEVAPAAALAALISLQSDESGRASRRLIAERALLLLDRLRDGLLAGRIADSDLIALADAAHAKTREADEELAAIYADIELRARVELAKLGR